MKLSEMSLQELWKLFPIILTEHNSEWAVWFSEEEKTLTNLLCEYKPYRISHIGSTAIEGIMAKPTVDILVEFDRECDLEKIGEMLGDNGYCTMSSSPERVSMNKGYTEKGYSDRVFHIHLRHFGDNDELYFRDFLKDERDVAMSYEALKLTLQVPFEHNRDAYTEGKTAFITRCTQTAKAKYGKRYD